MPIGFDLQTVIPGPERFFRAPFAVDTAPRITGVTPNAARTSGGTSITITGFNFRSLSSGATPTVLVGGVAAGSVVVVDQNTITCAAPTVADADVVDISVTIGSQTATLRQVFTFYEGTITKITPGFGVIAGSTTVIIEGYNFIAGTLVFFDGTLASEILVLDEQHISCKTPAHAQGFVDVVIIEPS